MEKQRKVLNNKNKLYLWKAQILWWAQNSASYNTTISLKFFDLRP